MTSSVAAQSKRSAAKSQRKIPTLALVAPSVIVLVLWMVVPLAMAVWYSFQRYNLLVPDN